MQRRWIIFSIVGLLSLVADLASKYWAEAVLEYGRPIEVLQNFFDWRLSYNTGSAFGLFGSIGGARIFLSIIGVVAVGFIIWMVKQTENRQTRLLTGLGLVAGGAIGNIYDRVLFGQVRDFIVWKYYDNQWPAFNIADVALVVGVGLLLLDYGRVKPSPDVTAKTKSPKKSAKSKKNKQRKR